MAVPSWVARHIAGGNRPVARGGGRVGPGGPTPLCADRPGAGRATPFSPAAPARRPRCASRSIQPHTDGQPRGLLLLREIDGCFRAGSAGSGNPGAPQQGLIREYLRRFDRPRRRPLQPAPPSSGTTWCGAERRCWAARAGRQPTAASSHRHAVPRPRETALSNRECLRPAEFRTCRWLCWPACFARSDDWRAAQWQPQLHRRDRRRPGPARKKPAGVSQPDVDRADPGRRRQSRTIARSSPHAQP